MQITLIERIYICSIFNILIYEGKNVGKSIIAAIVTFILGVFVEAYLGSKGDFRGMGIIVSVALMGGFIIYFNEKKK